MPSVANVLKALFGRFTRGVRIRNLKDPKLTVFAFSKYKFSKIWSNFSKMAPPVANFLPPNPNYSSSKKCHFANIEGESPLPPPPNWASLPPSPKIFLGRQ